MTIFDARKALHTKNFYRFTGPPENWLTAIKYMTWGLERKYIKRWKQISIGDVFLMHSTIKSFYKNVQSTIVGLGVVGGEFRIKDNFLWIHEIKQQKNIWPLLVPFSEIYLFSKLPLPDTWESPGIASDDITQKNIDLLLKGAPPLRIFGESAGAQFPVMGSWSSVRPEMTDKLLSLGTLELFSEFYKDDSYLRPQGKPVKFSPLRDAEESIRYVPSLKFLEGKGVKIRKPASRTSIFERDNALLERAEEEHGRILKLAIDFFRRKGFDTWDNPHVDLLAESEKKAFLVEVKSTVNKNFRKQARQAVGQLFEYEYFDVRQYFSNMPNPPRLSKVLMPSGDPHDEGYTNFLNTLKVHLAWPTGTRIAVRGEVGELASFIN